MNEKKAKEPLEIVPGKSQMKMIDVNSIETLKMIIARAIHPNSTWTEINSILLDMDKLKDAE